MKLSNTEILEYLKVVDKHLMNTNKIKFEYSIEWTNSKFDDSPAVYALFNNSELVYIGETSSLRKRMKDLRRTYNHTFRKQLGKDILKDITINKGVFSETEENVLTKYFENNIYITYKYMIFGRKEAETFLIHKYQDKQNNNGKILYNKLGKRDSTVIRILNQESKN